MADPHTPHVWDVVKCIYVLFHCIVMFLYVLSMHASCFAPAGRENAYLLWCAVINVLINIVGSARLS